MAKLDFGTYDLFQWNVIEAVPEPVDYYDQHLSEVYLAEQVGSNTTSSSSIKGTTSANVLRPRFTSPPWPNAPAPFVSAP